MMFPKTSFRGAALCAAVFLLSSLGAYAQVAATAKAHAAVERPNFNRPQTYDVQHYVIRASFDRAARKVRGDTTVILKPLKAGFVTAELDAADMVFSSVTLQDSGKKLRYRTTPGKVIVTLDKPYSPADAIAIRFTYTATPKKGVYFVDERKENGQIVNPAQVWSQGEADEAHHWFPCFDFPSDKATTEQYLTVKKGETVVANGELIDRKANADGTETVHYKMPVPHSIYLLSFVVGTYAKVEDTYNGIPLGYYVYPGKEDVARAAFGKTPEMMKVFEEVTGVKFPYNKYDQTIVAAFQFGGMENITATTMSDVEIFAATQPDALSDVEDLVSHELAHSWFGDLVTCKNWAELWLNEGFATFMEAVYREKAHGRDNYLNKVRNDAELYMIGDTINPNRNGLYNLNAGNVAALFDRPETTYNKGGAVLHTLREEIGDEAFWKAVNTYLNRHKLDSVESTDLRAAMEEASGKKLDWFFDQWVYHGGFPKLTVAPIFNPNTNTLDVSVTQTQKADKLTPEVFRLPMSISVETEAGTKSYPLNVTKRIDHFVIKLEAKPTKLIVDREMKIPVKLVKMMPIGTIN
jgi:aminopeptidase N